MSNYPIIAISIALILLLFIGVAVVVYRRREELPETDYRALFIIGITWLPLGIAIDNLAFSGIGVVFIIVGLTNREKWKKRL